MAETRTSVFEDMAMAAGLKRKGAYTLPEIATATGISYDALRREANKGAIKTFLPPGRSRGYLVRPEWFDEWWEKGCS